MGKYKVKVNIELIECDDDVREHGPLKEKNGGFTMTISEQDAASIDKCEQSVDKGDGIRGTSMILCDS